MLRKLIKLLPMLVIPAVMLMMSLICSADSYSGLSVSSSLITPDDTFNVTVKVPPVNAYADSASVKVTFDSDYFSVVSWNPKLPDSKNVVSNYGDGFFAVSAAGDSRNIDLTEGLTLTATLKVRTGVKSGSSVISLEKHSFSYYDEDTNDIVELWEDNDVTFDSASIEITSEESGIGTSRYSVDYGERFTVNIYVPPLDYADSASIRVDYDGSAFYLKSWDPDIPGVTANSGNGFFSASAANSTPDIDLRSGLTLKATFEVRNGASSGTHKFRLTKSSFSYYDEETGDAVELWAPTKKEATITVNSPYITTTTTTTTYPRVTPYTGWVTNVTTSRHTTASSTVRTSSTTQETEWLTDDTTDRTRDTTIPPDDDPDDGDYPDDTTQLPPDPEKNRDNIKLAVDSKLTGLPKSKLSVGTKYRFFPTSTVITLENTTEAERCAQSAIRGIDLADHPYYSFDISLYGMTNGRPVQLVGNDAYIEFLMPVPTAMLKSGANIDVYHIENGYPERIRSSIEKIGNDYKIRFTATDFSPYMLIDTVNENLVTERDTPHDGALNPNTGVAAAIAVPAALTGCVLLARNSKRRKRARRAVDSDDDTQKRKKK